MEFILLIGLFTVIFLIAKFKPKNEIIKTEALGNFTSENGINTVTSQNENVTAHHYKVPTDFENIPLDERTIQVAKPGEVDEANYFSEKTGRFKVHKPAQARSYLVRIRDNTDYQEALFSGLDRQERLDYGLRNFECDIDYVDFEFEVDEISEMIARLSKKQKDQ